MSTSRRDFLKLLSTTAASTAFPASIARALAIPANNQTGTINDVEHIVFLSRRTARSTTISERYRACAASETRERSNCPPVRASFISRIPAIRTATYCPSIPMLPIWAKCTCSTHRTTGTRRTQRGTAEPMTSGCQTKARLAWRTTPEKIFRSTMRLPMPSPFATPTTARSSGPPTPTAIICGRAG